jgi:hypothetical protein
MAQLRKPNLFYDGLNNTFVAEVTKMYVSMQDQIERRPFNHLSAGNARYHARFGYSCNFSSFLSLTIACDTCYIHMRQATDPNTSYSFRDYDLCTNWMHNMDHPLLRSKAPKDYPVDAPYQEEKEGCRLLLPFELSYDGLGRDILIVQQKIVDESWSPNEAKSFLSVICVDTKTNAEIVRLAQSCQSLREVRSCVGQLSVTSKRVLQHYKDNPGEFCPLPIPIAWRRGSKLKQHVAVAMHLLFLGITKSTLQLTFKWFKLQGKCSNFLEFAAKLIGGVGPLKTMQLLWLDLTQLTGEKFGGWVAVHFVAFSRLLKWVFSIADIVIPDDEYEEPKYPPSDQWLVLELRGWLKCRGLDISGLKCDLLERVL